MKFTSVAFAFASVALVSAQNSLQDLANLDLANTDLTTINATVLPECLRNNCWNPLLEDAKECESEATEECACKANGPIAKFSTCLTSKCSTQLTESLIVGALPQACMEANPSFAPASASSTSTDPAAPVNTNAASATTVSKIGLTAALLTFLFAI